MRRIQQKKIDKPQAEAFVLTALYLFPTVASPWGFFRLKFIRSLLIVMLCFPDEESPDSQYVDLLLNPERFTGYKGPEAWQIWNSIYEENCFK